MSKKEGTELTLKQQRFAAEYCVDLNATAAYRRAGYNAQGNAAEACASRLLSNAKVQRIIQEKAKKLSSRREVTAASILRETEAVACSDIRKLFNSDGSPKSLHEIDDATAAAIRSFELGQMISEGKVVGQVYKIKLWDKNSALERLFKHHRLFDKDNSPEARIQKRVIVSFVSGDGQAMNFSDFIKRGEG